MKLSVVIISWNDGDCILDCIASIYAETCNFDFEVIVTDNGSSDGSLAAIREKFPNVKLVENRRNLGYGGGNNAGFRETKGEYVLILNPDTVVRDRALEKLVAYAEKHPEGGAWGTPHLNPDGSYQQSAYPIPTIRAFLVAAIYQRWLGRLSEKFIADTYPGWQGTAEREIGFQAGCCLLIRRELLRALGGFDERLFHQFEDADLCLRVWKSGKSVLFYPGAEVTHVGGQNRGRYPIPVVLETHRSRYRFFYKHYGEKTLRQIRWVSLIQLGVRFLGYQLLSLVRRREIASNRLKMLRVVLTWHWRIDPCRFIEFGEEPDMCHIAGISAPNGRMI